MHKQAQKQQSEKEPERPRKSSRGAVQGRQKATAAGTEEQEQGRSDKGMLQLKGGGRQHYLGEATEQVQRRTCQVEVVLS